jgi:hypothetical protein
MIVGMRAFAERQEAFALGWSMSSIKRDVKKKNFPTTGVEIVSRHPAHLGYASLRAAMAFHSHKIFPLSVTMRSSLGERQVTGVDLCQPWFYPRLMAYDYFWLSEEA